ncbi:MAG TPA: MGMT family protein [Candidatus Marinimicrobia bacterium]|nr:MGMT family protein [Candidatus Neomarinimicrobiota bacterium]HRS51774.1 MGMT family protein [Candidatus Neomarinimicrobiota bacterium]HRU93044.1 MGMT family protein [Candidatus Neomarinimicrobiota bacterium]
MTKQHLAKDIITQLCDRTLDYQEESTAFEHWRICSDCQTKIRTAIDCTPPWPHNLAHNTYLWAIAVSARWPFWLIGSNEVLLALSFSEKEHRREIEFLRGQGFEFDGSPEPIFLTETAEMIYNFLETGQPYKVAALNFYLVSTTFARQVLTWTGLVPFGKTTSYGQIAEWMGRPGAARSVGGALHSNPLGLVIPCHRVIGADSALTGFGGGLEMKRKLLELEGSYPKIQTGQFK